MSPTDVMNSALLLGATETDKQPWPEGAQSWYERPITSTIPCDHVVGPCSPRGEILHVPPFPGDFGQCLKIFLVVQQGGGGHLCVVARDTEHLQSTKTRNEGSERKGGDPIHQGGVPRRQACVCPSQQQFQKEPQEEVTLCVQGRGRELWAGGGQRGSREGVLTCL